MLKNYKYYLEGLDCPNCAKKIEVELGKYDDFFDVVVNFNLLTVSLKSSLDDPFNKVVEIVKKIEPDTLVYREKVESDKKDYEIIRLIGAIICFIVSYFIKLEVVSEVFLILSYLLLLYKTSIKAFKKILQSHNIDENLLIMISGIGAYILGEHMEGLMVLFLYVIGKILEDKAVNKSRNSIKELLALKVDKATLKVNNELKEVKSETLEVDDIIVVRKGELVPVDGVIVNGTSQLDNSSLTGESVLQNVWVGSSVLSGSINKGDKIELKVTHKYIDSTAYKILELTLNATNNKTKTETKVSQIARFYTPIVLIIAILISIFLPILFHVEFTSAIYRALTFLVISCPCAMAISVPLSYFAGIGSASKNKILVKGSNYLDEIGKIDTVVFDKTGTITTGTIKINKVNLYDKKYNEKEVMKIVAMGESFSTHPIAKFILSEVEDSLETDKVTDFKEISGKGIQYKIGEENIKVGSASFCNTKEEGNIFLTIDDKLISAIIFQYNIKDNAKDVITKLNQKNIETIMLTGDNESFAKIVADSISINEYYAGLLPQQKYKKLKELKNNHRVMFVGDGINDAPSLALSNVGVSMGSIGASSAIEASDVVIMNDDLENIITLFSISRKTNKIVMQNLIGAISIKILILVLATFGLASMWAAVFADTGLTLLTIINSLRILKIRKNN